MTRSQTRARKSPPCHSLNFFFDDENGCAYTILVHGYRFHVIADAKNLESNSKIGRELQEQYLRLISAVRDSNAEDEKPTKFRPKHESDVAEIHAPQVSQLDDRDSGQGSSPPSSPTTENDDADSAVDVNEARSEDKSKVVDVQKEGFAHSQTESDDPEKSLKNWLLAPFTQIFQDLETNSEHNEEQSIQEWYTGPTYFYNLTIQDDELKPVEIESQPDLEDRIKALVPHMSIPKTLREGSIPWIKASDAFVISESNEPDPYHPSRVRVGDKVSFIKMVDPTQPQPTKRELKIMKEIEKKGIHKKIRVPIVEGLIGYADSETEIMGFLMTNIEDPTPLTVMLDTDVIEDRREKWARDSAHMVKVLHDHNIIWGDAKADNFMVDKHGDLWIIDFGGSYTDGWVDPELMETLEGDDMGTEKVVNALEDPEANTYDPDEEIENDENNDNSKSSKYRTCRKPTSAIKKRARDEDDTCTDTTSAKRQRQNS